MARTGLTIPRFGVGRSGLRAPVSAKLINRATAAWKAGRATGDGQYLYDLTGNGHHAQFGSQAPARVFADGPAGQDGFLRLPGVAGNYASVPDEAALDITGDIDVRARLSSSWSPPSPAIVLSKDGGGSNRTWAFAVMPAGGLRLETFADGSTVNTFASTASVPFSAGEVGWVRAVLDADDGAGGAVVRFYTSTDYDPDSETGTWTQLGADRTLGSTTSLYNSTADVEVGARSSGASNVLAGTVARAQLFDGIDGTKVLDVDFTGQADGADAITAVTGQTVTVSSTPGADTNDPKLLTCDDGKQYAYLPGVAGNYLYVEDGPTLDITGDLDLRIDLAADDWSNGDQMLLSKIHTGHPSTAYGLRLTGLGYLRLTWSEDGTTWIEKVSGLPVPAADGERLQVRATLDVDNGAGGYDVTFYTRGSYEEAWVQLGSTITGGVTTSVHAGTARLEIGSRNHGTVWNLTGKVYAAEVRDGVDGTVVASFDATDRSRLAEPFNTYTDPQGNTWTLKRESSGRKLAVVDRTLLLFGTDDYLEAPDHPALDVDAGDDLTDVVLFRGLGTSAANNYRLIVKRSGTIGSGIGPVLYWSITSDAVLARIDDSDGPTRIASATPGMASGQLGHAALRLDRATDTIEALTSEDDDSSTAAGADDLSNAAALRVGEFLDGEIVGAARFVGEALTDTELAQVAAELKAA